MIAQDFARVRVLASGSIRAIWCSERVRARGQKTSEGAAALSAPGTMLEMGK